MMKNSVALYALIDLIFQYQENAQLILIQNAVVEEGLWEETLKFYCELDKVTEDNKTIIKKEEEINYELGLDKILHFLSYFIYLFGLFFENISGDYKYDFIILIFSIHVILFPIFYYSNPGTWGGNKNMYVCYNCGLLIWIYFENNPTSLIGFLFSLNFIIHLAIAMISRFLEPEKSGYIKLHILLNCIIILLIVLTNFHILKVQIYSFFSLSFRFLIHLIILIILFIMFMALIWILAKLYISTMIRRFIDPNLQL